MKSSINKIAVIGTGVIGTGWIIRFLAKNKIVYVYDHDSSQYKFLKSEIKRVSKLILKHYNIKKLKLDNLYFKNSIKLINFSKIFYF